MKLTRHAVCLCAAGLLLLPFVTLAAQNNTAINVTTTVYDYNGTTQLLTRSDGANSGQPQATYQTVYTNGKTVSYTSQILTDGTFRLNLQNQTARTIWITPNQAIDSTQSTNVPPAGYYPGDIFSGCTDASGNTVSFPNLVNGSSNCHFGINFSYNGVTYKLALNPKPPAGAVCPSTGCPATGLATVACNTVNSSNQCINWTISPNTTAPNATVGNLYRMSTTKNSTAWTFVGQYYNTFLVNITNP